MNINCVIPVYNSEKTLKLLIETILQEMPDEGLKVTLVDDGSKDQSWNIVKELIRVHPHRICGVKLSRNYGQHRAIRAGLSALESDYYVVMDCDLQDHPKYLKTMYEKLVNEHADIVYTKKRARIHSGFKNITARLYFKIFNFLCDTQKADENIGNYSMMKSIVRDNYLKYGDMDSHHLMIMRDLGFVTTFLDIEHFPRAAGKSSYNFKKLVVHAINGIVSNSNKLLLAPFLIASILVFVQITLIPLLCFNLLEWPVFLVLSFLVLISLVFSLILGFFGLHITKIQEQVKARPHFIISEKIYDV